MIKFLVLVLMLLQMGACGTIHNKTKMHNEKTILCGGYTQQRPLDDAEKALFAAVTASVQGVSYTPQSVAMQVVAGTNYRFHCTAVTHTEHPHTYQAEIIVYQPLPQQGEPRITKITKIDTAKKIIHQKHTTI